MSYTYPEALDALQAIANDFIKIMRPRETAPVRLICDISAQTASVRWDAYSVTVTMPVRPATSRMTQNEFEDWTGYLLHELGHPTYTDLKVWQDAVRSGHARMLNALEDVRMEKAVIKSGVALNARAVLSRLLGRKIAEARTTDWRPNARKDIGWTICVLGRAANGYTFDPADLAWIKGEIKPGSTVGTVLAWAMPELAACNSTQDCLDLAKRIAAAIAAPAVPGPDEGKGEGEGESDGEGEGEGDGGEGVSVNEVDGEGEGDEGADESENAPGEAPKPDKRPSSDNGEGQEGGKGGTGHGNGTIDADETPVTDADLTEHALAPESETMPRAHNEKAVLDILRSGVLTQPPLTSAGTSPTRGAKLRDSAARASRQRAQLARALRANETDDREGGRRAGRLDKGALSRAMSGATNVFQRREISEGYDTDVAVLLDASGSMQGRNMAMALEVGLIVAQAAGSVGASCTTEIFNQTGYRRAGALASKRAPNPAEYGALVDYATGGTPLSAHMARVAVSQAKRAPHKRRVVFVITDGGCNWGTQTVKRMADYLEKTQGTILAHISIHTPLQGAFKAEVCVPYGTELADLGLDHFVKVLRAL